MHNISIGKEVGNIDFLYNAIEIRSNSSADRYFIIFKVRNILKPFTNCPCIQQSNPTGFFRVFQVGRDRTNNKYIVNGNLQFQLQTEVTVPDVDTVTKNVCGGQGGFLQLSLETLLSLQTFLPWLTKTTCWI